MQTQLPNAKLCDKYGNMLAYDFQREVWVIVTYNKYVKYAALYSQWAYLPAEPDATLLTSVSTEDVVFLQRVSILLLQGDLVAAKFVNRHFDRFDATAKSELIKRYSQTEGSYDIEYVLLQLARVQK